MGQVYCAYDTKLDREVAIKFINPKGSEQNISICKRMLIEARAIARLTHKHIVAIYRTGEIQGHPYLVYELVAGQSLDKYPKPIPWKQVLKIGLSVARALAHAHARGVLHRDIKPANIMIFPTAAQSDDVEVKLLDFGLAKLVEVQNSFFTDEVSDAAQNSEDVSGLTRTGEQVGTPRYMAPELWRGAPASPSTDLFSLGVVLYELCSNELPYKAKGVVALRRAVSECKPISLSARLKANRSWLVETFTRWRGNLSGSQFIPSKLLPKRQPVFHGRPPAVNTEFARFIDRCIGSSSQPRFSTASELIRELESFEQSNNLFFGRTILLALMAVALMSIMIFWSYSSRLPTASVAVPRKATVAILPFSELDDKTNKTWLSAAVPEMIGLNLSVGEYISIVPEERILQLLPNFSESQYDRKAIVQLLKVIPADYFIIGSYRRTNRKLLLKIQLLNSSKEGRVEQIVASDLFGAALMAGEQVRIWLKIPRPDNAALAQAQSAAPSTEKAAQLWVTGQAHLRAYDYQKALVALQAAEKECPQSPLIYFALAQAWLGLSNQAKHRWAANHAFELSNGLSGEERLRLRAYSLFANRDFNRAEELQSSIFFDFGKKIWDGIALANTQMIAGNNEGAGKTISALRHLPDPVNADPLIDIIDAWQRRRTGDPTEALAILLDGERKAKAAGMHFLEVRMRSNMASALVDLGRVEDVIQIGRSIHNDLIDYKLYNELFWTEMLLGSSLVEIGKLSEAIERLSEVELLAEERGERLHQFWIVLNAVEALRISGHLAEANDKLSGASELLYNYPSLINGGGPYAALALEKLAIALAKSDVQEARTALAAAATNDADVVAVNKISLKIFQGWLSFFESDFDAANTHTVSALREAEKANYFLAAATSKYYLSEILVAKGSYEDAILQARDLIRETSQRKMVDREGLARSTLVVALLAAGRIDEARVEAALLRTIVERTKSVLLQLRGQLSLSQVPSPNSSSTAASLAALDAVAMKARKVGYHGEELLARLAMGKLELDTKQRLVGLARIRTVLVEAKAAGLIYIVKQSQAVLRKN